MASTWDIVTYSIGEQQQLRLVDRGRRDFSRTPARDFCFFLPISISHTRTSSGKYKKRTAASWPHIVLWRHCNVKMTSPCRNTFISGFSGSLFHVFFQYKMRYLVVSKKKNPLFVWGWDSKICPAQSPIVITLLASWWQSVNLGTEFSIPPSHSWWILILLQKFRCIPEDHGSKYYELWSDCSDLCPYFAIATLDEQAEGNCLEWCIRVNKRPWDEK